MLAALFSINLTAQVDQPLSQEKNDAPLEFYLGFIYAPSAATVFDNDPIFSSFNTLFFTPVVAKGDWSLAPYYNLSTNNTGAFLNYNVSDKLGAYIVGDKALQGNTGNYILGFTTPVAADYIQLYLEVGRTYGDNSSTFLAMGIYFNILQPIKF